MRPRSRLVDAAAALLPVRQRELGALCGLYSIMNGVQLVMYPYQPLRPAQRRRLYRHGIAWLAQYDDLAAVLSVGMAETIWRRLTVEMLSEVRRLTGVSIGRSFPLRRKAPLSSDAIAGALKSSLRAGRPVLLCLYVTYDHFTVAYGFDANRLLLFDSTCRRWIKFASIDHIGAREGGCHWLSVPGVVALDLELSPTPT